jgi:hypothetical protein
VHVFWQSASMLHEGAQPGPPVEVDVLVLPDVIVVVLPPALMLPPVPVPPPAPLDVVWWLMPAPVPNDVPVLDPFAQATTVVAVIRQSPAKAR